jgi:hypothetical protein
VSGPRAALGRLRPRPVLRPTLAQWPRPVVPRPRPAPPRLRAPAGPVRPSIPRQHLVRRPLASRRSPAPRECAGWSVAVEWVGAQSPPCSRPACPRRPAAAPVRRPRGGPRLRRSPGSPPSPVPRPPAGRRGSGE